MNRRSGAPVDIRTVAEAAGVSVTTVSHALSGKGRVSEQTRERVVRIAEDLGYRANSLAQGLASTGQHGVLGLRISSPVDGQSMRSAAIGYFVDLTNAAAAAARDSGYWLALAPPTDTLGMSSGRLNLDGAVVVDPLIDDPFVKLLVEERIPLVTTGRPIGRNIPYWVDNDHSAATTQALDHLARSGARRIAVISIEPRYSYVVDALTAYESWCLANRMEPLLEVVDVTTEEAGYTAAMKLLQGERPDGIYATLDRLAIGVVRAADALSIGIPSELRVACLTETADARGTQPPLTTVDLRADEIGREAIRMLLLVIHGLAPATDHRIVPVSIIPRASTGSS